MTITEAQLTEAQRTERAATQQAIEHLNAAIERLKSLPDDGELFDYIIEDIQDAIETLDEVYGESFIDAGEDASDGAH